MKDREAALLIRYHDLRKQLRAAKRALAYERRMKRELLWQSDERLKIAMFVSS